MIGFILIAKTKKGEKVIRNFNIRDKKAVISCTENPLTLKVFFLARFQNYIREDSVVFFITKTMKDNDLILNEDYLLEVKK